MSQPIHPGQLKTVNNKLAELGKTMVYQPDMFRSHPCRCTMTEEKLLRTIKRKPVPYCSETMLENLRKQDTRRLHLRTEW